MFDKNLIDFHENFEAVSNLKTSIRHGSVCGTKASSVLDEAKSYVARMESITGMKFLVTGTEETESWLSDSQKLRLRAERMSDAFSNLHPHIPLFNTKEQSEDLDYVYKALDFLGDKMKMATGIRLETMRGGTPKQFNSVASVLTEFQPYISPRIRLESHGGSNWDSLKYRAEGVVSWISDKIKKLINWILGLFGFKGSEKKQDSGKREKSPEEKKKDQEYQKSFAKTHQATKEQQMAIKKFVDDLEKEYGDKYSPAAYDAADRNYLKKVDIGEEKDPITKAKAKYYLDEAQKKFGDHDSKTSIIDDTKGKRFTNNDIEDVSIKGTVDNFSKQASNMLSEIDKNDQKREDENKARQKQADLIISKHFRDIETSIGANFSWDDKAAIKDKFKTNMLFGKYRDARDEKDLVEKLTMIAKSKVGKVEKNTSNGDDPFVYSVRPSFVSVLLQKRENKVSIVDSKSFSELDIAAFTRTVEKLIDITKRFTDRLNTKDDNRFSQLIDAVTNVFNQRLPIKGGTMVYNSDYGHIYQFVNPNKCMAVAYSVDGGYEVLEHKFDISRDEAENLKFDSAQKDTLLKLVKFEVERFYKLDKSFQSDIESKIKSLESILVKASEDLDGETTILFNILKIVGRLGAMRVEMVKYFDKLREVSEDSFVVVI